MEYTYIVQKEQIQIGFKEHIPTKKAIQHARDYGLSGRIEIHHIIEIEETPVTYSMSFINQNNKITGQLFP